MLFRLPSEIKNKIYQYDSTWKDLFDKTIHQIKMANIRKMIETMDWYTHFRSYRFSKSIGLRPDEELTRSYWWKKFRDGRLRKN